MMRWLELSDQKPTARFTVLQEELKQSGLENEFQFRACAPDELVDTIASVKKEFSQIRLSGTLGHHVLHVIESLPSLLLTLQVADSYVEKDGQWWPRCYLYEAIGLLFAQEISNVDFSGEVFINGCSDDARAFVAALSRIGFQRFTLSDTDTPKGEALVKALKKTYFGVKFQFTPREMITQLAGVNSVAVNIIEIAEHPQLANELFYFNFLRASGVWIDTQTGPLQSNLENEARSIGGIVLDAKTVNSLVDTIWAKEVLGLSLDRSRYMSALQALAESK